MSTISYSCGITVLDAASGAREDVLVSIDGTATVRDVAHAIEDSLASRAPSAATAGPARTGAATEGPAGRGPGAGAWRREPADERAGDQRLAIVIRHPRFTQAAAASLPGPGPSPAEPRLGHGDRDPLTLWVDGGPLAAELPAARVLRDGMVVSLSPRYAPATSLAEPGGVAEVRIVGGPASGSVRRLGLGRFEIGGDPRCAVAVADPSVPPRAAVVSVAPDGASLEPAPGATLALDGEALGGPAAWPYGGVLAVGDSLLALHLPEEADASLVPGDDGGLVYNRPPRLLPPRRSRRLVVPSQPVKGDGPRLGVPTMVLPALFGVGMAVMLHQVLYLGMALLGPLTMGAGAWSDKRTGRKRHGAAMREYEQARRKHSEDLERLRAADEVERREACPDPATLLLVATGPRRRLWERRAGDHDVLRLRVGTADLPAAIELARDRGGPRPTEEEGGGPPDARHVPVPLDLEALGVVGVAGDRAAARGLARWLVAQAAILHSPRDLQVVVLAPRLATTEDWEWVRWLPHAQPRDGQDCIALLGTDAETVSRRVGELVDEVSSRRAESRSFQAGSDAAERPRLLVVLDGAQALRRVPGMPQVLGEGPGVGVHAICVDDDERLLPEECRTVATWQWDEPARLRLRGGGLDPVGTILGDQVGAAWCDRVARALAPIRDLGRDAAGMLPDSARLLDLLAMPDPEPELIERSWRRAGRTTEVVLGYASDGPFGLDLRRDGPHALVAGTTGAGKSELLQTLIASLAVANRPDAMTFVLIDYKGGSAFKDCARLPHTVGMVSDLDGHLTQRALASLSAELKRREELLLHAGAKDIEDYWVQHRRQPGLEPLPRLVLIIDEFASLVAELPDFVTGLVGIAQRGRSLGVHLVLATQRPAGVVSADIRANTNLRIALRVTDAAESSDVIDAPDAAGIARSTPGRCYVRSGASSLTAVQAARVGGRRPGASKVAAAPLVARVSWADLGRPAPRPAAGDGEDDASTDLSVLVGTIREAARRLGVASGRSPWLPPIAEVVAASDLPPVETGRHGGEVAPLGIGLVDVPAEQRRRTLALDLVNGGHLLVAGSPRTGRSTVLRTVAGAVAAGSSPADVHLYGIDCGANALLPLVGLPHCGAIVGRDQPERVDRLLGRLLAEVSRRQQLFAEQGASSLAEQRAAAPDGARLPWMVLLLDRWEGFTAAFESYDLGRLVETMLRLLREGPAVGLRAVVSSDASGFVGQISTVFEERLLLRFADPDDWGRAGIPSRDVPTTMPPGRALLPAAAGLLEAQVALLDPDPSGPAQVAALQAIGRAAAARHQGVPQPRSLRPLRVDALPPRVTAAEALRLDPELAPPSPLWALIGAGGDALGPVGVDLLRTSPGFVVAGPPRSGRSTVLETMTRSLVARGVPVALVTPRRSPLRALATLDGVLGVLATGSEDVDALDKLLDGLERHVVLVDDAELLLDTSMGERLEGLVRTARDADQAVVAAGTTDDLGSQYRGFVVDVRRSRSGLLISPRSPGDGDLLGARLPRNMAAGPPGRGLLVLNGTVTPVQAALPAG
jgi:DNA segregation ATPase FtsK/SpoIIIE, S-DNA-T family